MATLLRARQAKESIRPLLGRLKTLRGLGIGVDGDNYFLKVNVEELTDHVRKVVPSTFEGVPVLVEAVGSVRAVQPVNKRERTVKAVREKTVSQRTSRLPKR